MSMFNCEADITVNTHTLANTNLDEPLGKKAFCVVNDKIDTSEVVSGFNDVVHVDTAVGYADGAGLVDIPRLVVSETAALNVVGVVGEVNLNTVIYAAGLSGGFFGFEYVKQSLRRCVASFLPDWSGCVGRNRPCLSGEKSARNAPLGAIITHASGRYIPFFCDLDDRKVFHTRPPRRW